MNLKTYQAYSMSEVLTRIRQDLGKRAVVLHTRTFRRGGILGIGARTVYEVTASDNPRAEFPNAIQPPPKRPPPQRNGTKQANGISVEQPRGIRHRNPPAGGSEAEQTILAHLQQHQTRRNRSGSVGSAGTSTTTTTASVTKAGNSAINSCKSKPSASGGAAIPGNSTLTSADKLLASLSEIGQQADQRIETTKSRAAPDRLKFPTPSADNPPTPRAQNGLQNNGAARQAPLPIATAVLPANPPVPPPETRRLKTEPPAPLERVAKRFLIDPQTGRAIPASESSPRKLKPAPHPPAAIPVAANEPGKAPVTGRQAQPGTVAEIIPAAKALQTTTAVVTQTKKKAVRKSASKKATKPKRATRKSPATKATSKSTAKTAATRQKAEPAVTELLPATVVTIPTDNHNNNNNNNDNDSVQTELAALRELVAEVLKQQQRTEVAPAVGRHPTGKPAPNVSAALTKHYAELIEHEVAEELANEICGLIQNELSPVDLHDDEVIRARILAHLTEYLPVVESALVDGQRIHADGRPLTMALVGPTGVGKTTTIAKLAASFKLREQVTVGMITTDTYRIAAVDQLRTYAEIIGVPLKVALTPAELASACHALRDVDVILIDTAGRSPNDRERINEIQSFIRAADPHETHLVLSSASSEQVMLRTIERFATVSADRVIFTKLDEAVNFGVIVNVMRKVDKKLSFITTGQEVPDQIERGEAARLARLILGESLHA